MLASGTGTILRALLAADLPIVVVLVDRECAAIEIARNIADIKVRRLPVMNRDKRLVGILSLGDMARKADGEDCAADALKSVSEPGGAHSQSAVH